MPSVVTTALGVALAEMLAGAEDDALIEEEAIIEDNFSDDAEIEDVLSEDAKIEDGLTEWNGLVNKT